MIKRILGHPFTFILSLILGTYTGLVYPTFAKELAPFSDLYLDAIQVVVIPIIMIYIIISINSMLTDHRKYSVLRSIGVPFLFLLLVGLWGILWALVTEPGILHKISLEMANIINQSSSSLIKELTVSDPIDQSSDVIVSDFISNFFPSNIVAAISNGQMPQLVAFSIVAGIALSFCNKEVNSKITDMFDSFKSLFQEIARGVTFVLPIGMYFLLAYQFSHITADIIFALLKFITLFLVAVLILLICCSLIIWRCSTFSYIESLTKFVTPVFVAFSARNSLAAMPLAIDVLTDHFKFERAFMASLLSLGLSICRYGNIMYFTFSTIFISQLYSIPIEISSYGILLSTAALAAVMTSGSTGVATLYMMAVILDPLGLPFGAVVVLLLAIDPIIDPLRSAVNLYANCAVTVLDSSLRLSKKHQLN